MAISTIKSVEIVGLKSVWFTRPFNDQLYFYPVYDQND